MVTACVAIMEHATTAATCLLVQVGSLTAWTPYFNCTPLPGTTNGSLQLSLAFTSSADQAKYNAIAVYPAGMLPLFASGSAPLDLLGTLL